MSDIKFFDNGKYYLLGLDADDCGMVHFVSNKNGDLMLYSYNLISEEEQRDAAYDSVDMYDEWKTAVANWDTEDWYSDWSDNQDIWEYFDQWSYYDFPSEVYHKCEEEGYLDSWQYPDYYTSKEITAENVNDVLEVISEDDRNQETYDNLIAEFWLNTMTFIQTEPIR